MEIETFILNNYVMILGSGNFKMCRAGWVSEDPEESRFCRPHGKALRSSYPPTSGTLGFSPSFLSLRV
jgi:hypothetical protein